ncbi:serine/threonine-protein kinase [Nannocystis sp.]|uniref:serine/threonine-protein kinase n=1 Tax=Nannocystis sp. TaxID=1962667 RepID=UPI0025F38539|nr:serine/threonine-protein kinase [Nannocystis sp.]
MHDPALDLALRAVLARLSEGAALPREHAGVAALTRLLAEGAPLRIVEAQVRELSRGGYLRGALVSVAGQQRLRPRADLLLLLAHELCDALAPDLGCELARAVLSLPAAAASRWHPGGPYVAANLLLGESLLEAGDALAALRHFEAVLAVELDHGRALRGYHAALRRGAAPRVASPGRGLGLLAGLDEVELAEGLGVDRYELGRPLGRGRHAVVYQAFDRRVGREVAIKRLVAENRDDAARGEARVIGARFFAEARTLARVRSPHVVALLDVQPTHRFIALSLCRGGNLRVAMRRRLLGPADLPRVGAELQAALRAVHAAGAVHRDIKPANILVREAREASPIALADFGLAQGSRGAGGHAGTLRYLAPELRSAAPVGPLGQVPRASLAPSPTANSAAPTSATTSARPTATPASDIFSAGVVLLELALAPGPLPAPFDHVASDFDAAALVPEGLPDGWTPRLRAMLAQDPDARGL